MSGLRKNCLCCEAGLAWSISWDQLREAQINQRPSSSNSFRFEKLPLQEICLLRCAIWQVFFSRRTSTELNAPAEPVRNLRGGRPAADIEMPKSKGDWCKRGGGQTVSGPSGPPRPPWSPNAINMTQAATARIHLPIQFVYSPAKTIIPKAGFFANCVRPPHPPPLESWEQLFCYSTEIKRGEIESPHSTISFFMHIPLRPTHTSLQYETLQSFFFFLILFYIFKLVILIKKKGKYFASKAKRIQPISIINK